MKKRLKIFYFLGLILLEGVGIEAVIRFQNQGIYFLGAVIACLYPIVIAFFKDSMIEINLEDIKEFKNLRNKNNKVAETQPATKFELVEYTEEDFIAD